MALNKSNDDLIQKRRERVARFRLQGLTIREIAMALSDEKIVNPDTGKPFDIATVHTDLDALKTEWQVNAARDASEFISEQLAELDELKKSAWKDKRYDVVMKCMERRAKLLGLDKPTNISVDLPGLKAYIGVSPDQWDEPAKTEGNT